MFQTCLIVVVALYIKNLKILLPFITATFLFVSSNVFSFKGLFYQVLISWF